MKHGNESVCSKMAAKRPHAVQKELTTLFGFSQSRSKKAYGLKFYYALMLKFFFLIPEVSEEFFMTLKADIFTISRQDLTKSCTINKVMLS